MRTKKARRRYSLFEKRDGKWVRLSDYSYFKSSAVSTYQGSLLSSYFEGKTQELRSVPTCKNCERELVTNIKHPHFGQTWVCGGNCHD